MKLTSLLAALFFSFGCTLPTNSDVVSKPSPSKYHIARVTYYYPQPPYGSKVACPKTKYAAEGVTVAAHPDFKFGTKLYIPDLKGSVGDGYFTVQDRGSAVTSKRASKGSVYVVDVFVKSRSKLQLLTKTEPAYMKVYVVSP